jgi:uncharacterized OB-fold protein
MNNPPKTIYLQPDCPNCGEGHPAERRWCEDNVWSNCPNCREPLDPIKYELSEEGDSDGGN